MPFDPFAIYDSGNPNLLWSLEIDWAGTGSYDENQAHERLVDLDVLRGRERFIRPLADGFEPMSNGVAVVTLDNEDERYNPDNTVSDLYGNLNAGKFAQIKVKNSGSGTPHPLLAGKVRVVGEQYALRAVLVFPC